MCLHIDPKQIKTIAGECICCGDPEELQKQLLNLAESDFENIVIESSGVTSLNQLLSKVINNQELAKHFEIGGCIFLVDAMGMERTNVNDLEIANFVIITKFDEVKNISDFQKIDNFIKNDFPNVHFLTKENLTDVRWVEKLLEIKTTNFRDWNLKVSDVSHHGQNFMKVLLPEDLINFNPEKAFPKMKEKQILRIKGLYQKNGLTYHVEATPELNKIEVSVDKKDKFGIVVIGQNKILLDEFVIFANAK